MKTHKTNFNDSFKIEKLIQDQTKLLLHNKSPSIRQISNIIAGRAGTHSCYRRNFFMQQLNKMQNSRKVSKTSDFSLLACTRRCKFLSRIKSLFFTLLVVINSVTFFKQNNKLVSNVLVFSTPAENIRTSDIYNFILQQRIRKHLRCKEPKILVQKKGFNLLNANKYQNIKSTRYIPLYMLRNNLSIKHKFYVQKTVVKNLFKLLKTKNCDFLYLCSKELIFEELLYKTLELNHNLDIIYTQSNLRVLSQISYVASDIYKVRNLMIWYSTNSTLIYKKNLKPFKIQSNYLSLDLIDRHLVWDTQAKIDLAKITTRDIYVCGSLLFYPWNKQNRDRNFSSSRVLLFDITPRENAPEEEFLNPIQSINSIREIVNAIEDLRVNANYSIDLIIKPKRSYSPHASKAYLSYLQELKSDKKITLLNHSQNLYELINNSSLVICFPWTSTALIASELGVKSVYYISDRKKQWDLKQTRNINLIRNEKDLTFFIKNHFAIKTN